MNMTPWDPDGFHRTLTARVEDLLAGPCDQETLASGIATCADAGEEICRGRAAACSSGCPHCCVLNVAILLPEAAVIAEWLTTRLGNDELAAVADRLTSHISWARWMDDEERISRRAFCPFLDEASCCTIHPVRPLACRGVVSLDRERCREAFSPIISDEERWVPADLMRRSVFDTAFTTLGQALKQRGLDYRSIELGAGVLAFLEEPKRCGELLAGRKLPRELWG